MIKKTRSKKSSKKMSESNMQHMHAWLFALAVITVLAVGVPVMLWAQQDEAPKRVSVDAGALSSLQMKVGELQKALDELMAGEMDMDERAMAYVSRPDDARADCLNQCRMEQVSCIESYDGEMMENGLHPCLEDASECITSCNNAPRAPVSCQDRCAVALGGCVQRVVAPHSTAVADEQAALDDCRLKNVECLQNACRMPDDASMPDSYCADQCRRMHIICSTGSSQYDENSMELCTRLKQTCEQRLCARVGLLPNVKLMENEQYGNYLVDANGMTLYTFAEDAKGKSACTGACLDKWPVFYQEELWVGDNLDEEHFGSVMREDGEMQITYKGWPLYYYVDDMVLGDVKGHMVNDVWFLAGPGTEMLTRSVCDEACDADYEECKRSDEMPYACQQQIESCRGGCLDLESSETL